MNPIKKARWGFRLFRILTIALLGYLLATALVQASETVEGFVAEDSIEILKSLIPVQKTNKLPVTGSPEWHPSDNRVGHWGVERVLIGDELVEKRCKQPAYGCASSSVKEEIITCTIYMPDFVRKDNAPISYKGLYNRVGPDRKPPRIWFWLLGREKAHCLYGTYHD